MPTYVVTLRGFSPVARYDGDPFVNARIEESPNGSAPWTALETQALSPVDPDPANPLSRDFTTDLAQLVDGWYRIVFIDGSGDERSSGAVQGAGSSTVLPPTLADLRARSPFLNERFPSPAQDSNLQNILTVALRLLKNVTCRTFDSSMPADLVELAIQALVLKSESLGGAFISRSGAKVALRSFQAGSYSESYFGPGEAAKAGAMDPNPQLAELLIALATDECLDEFWAQNGKPAPASIIVAPAYADDYRRY